MAYYIDTYKYFLNCEKSGRFCEQLAIPGLQGSYRLQRKRIKLYLRLGK